MTTIAIFTLFFGILGASLLWSSKKKKFDFYQSHPGHNLFAEGIIALRDDNDPKFVKTKRSLLDECS